MQCLCMTITFRSLDANQLFQKGLCKFPVFSSKSGEYCQKALQFCPSLWFSGRKYIRRDYLERQGLALRCRGP